MSRNEKADEIVKVTIKFYPKFPKMGSLQTSYRKAKQVFRSLWIDLWKNNPTERTLFKRSKDLQMHKELDRKT